MHEGSHFSTFFFLCSFRATSTAYGGSQARSLELQLLVYATSMGTEPHLWPRLQLVATPYLYPTEWGQGSNLYPHEYFRFLTLLSHNGNSSILFTKTVLEVNIQSRSQDVPAEVKGYYLIIKYSISDRVIFWGRGDLWYCVSFWCTAKWVSYTYTYIHSIILPIKNSHTWEYLVCLRQRKHLSDSNEESALYVL